MNPLGNPCSSNIVGMYWSKLNTRASFPKVNLLPFTYAQESAGIPGFNPKYPSILKIRSSFPPNTSPSLISAPRAIMTM